MRILLGQQPPIVYRFLLASLLLCLLASLPLSAQQRPLRTPDAEILPPGTLRVQVGFDFLQDVSFPLAGLGGDQTSLGVIGVRLGVGKMVELQLEGAVRHFLDVKQQVSSFVTPVLTGARSTNDIGDFSLLTKIRIFGETEKRPSLAVRFGFQMPNSNQVRGIGTNTSDLFMGIILQKHIRKLNVWGQVGMAILQSPVANFTQNDALTYGGAFIYPLHKRVNLVGEVAGRQSTRKASANLLGTESRAQGRLGIQLLVGGFLWDFAGIAGIHRNDPKTGFTFGVTRDIRLFDFERIK
jgi:hypothetical protein